jgi:hypothetical protein
LAYFKATLSCSTEENEENYENSHKQYSFPNAVQMSVVFWDVMPCSLVARYLRNLIPQASGYKKCSNPEDGGSRFLQITGTHLPNYVTSQGGKKQL